MTYNIKNKTKSVRKFRERKKSIWTYLKPGESTEIEEYPAEGYSEGVFEISEKKKTSSSKKSEESGKGEKKRKARKRTKLNKEE